MTEQKTINDIWDRMEEILEENDNKPTAEYDLLFDLYMRLIEQSNQKMRERLKEQENER